MSEFTPMASLLGGVLIGLSTVILRVFTGKTAGISGIVGATLRGAVERWRLAFIGGMVVGGLVVLASSSAAIAFSLDRSWPTLVVAGLLIGYGTQLGGGCTSGHGVCGISRGSGRSLVATCVFMATAMLTVAAMRLLGGGVA
ncbi:MAG: YeeE/YedE family protein [Deltaproteobacteria bacterium]|nr:YeeE/YedE family protein [Deltaproteobacteria bacterium]